MIVDFQTKKITKKIFRNKKIFLNKKIYKNYIFFVYSVFGWSQKKNCIQNIYFFKEKKNLNKQIKKIKFIYKLI